MIRVEPSGEGSGFSGLVVGGLQRLFRGFWGLNWADGALAETLKRVGEGQKVVVSGSTRSAKGVEVRVIEEVDTQLGD